MRSNGPKTPSGFRDGGRAIALTRPSAPARLVLDLVRQQLQRGEVDEVEASACIALHGLVVLVAVDRLLLFDSALHRLGCPRASIHEALKLLTSPDAGLTCSTSRRYRTARQDALARELIADA